MEFTFKHQILPIFIIAFIKTKYYIHLLWVKTENPGARKFDIRFSIDNSIANITLYSQVPNKRVGWLFSANFINE